MEHFYEYYGMTKVQCFNFINKLVKMDPEIILCKMMVGWLVGVIRISKIRAGSFGQLFSQKFSLLSSQKLFFWAFHIKEVPNSLVNCSKTRQPRT